MLNGHLSLWMILVWIGGSVALASIVEWAYQRGQRKRGIPPCAWYG